MKWLKIIKTILFYSLVLFVILGMYSLINFENYKNVKDVKEVVIIIEGNDVYTNYFLTNEYINNNKYKNVKIDSESYNELFMLYKKDYPYESGAYLRYEYINDTYYINGLLPSINLLNSKIESLAVSIPLKNKINFHTHPDYLNSAYDCGPSEKDTNSLIYKEETIGLIGCGNNNMQILIAYDKIGNIYPVRITNELVMKNE